MGSLLVWRHPEVKEQSQLTLDSTGPLQVLLFSPNQTSSSRKLAPVEATLPDMPVEGVYSTAESCDSGENAQHPHGAHAGRIKKTVTFADHRGLSLTRVKLFSQFNDPIRIPTSVRQSFEPPQPTDDKLVLDFNQPAADYLHFRQSLEQNRVSLEHCVLKDHTLAGTVKVRNLSFEKSVKLRITFDSWKSHSDVACTYVKDSYPSSYCDTFSFTLLLPRYLKPNACVEFAVFYLVGDDEFWDSNHGRNYRILWASMKGRGQDHNPDFGIHFDSFGSPTCSHGIFPDWPSYAGYEHQGPYY
ncbi:protein phosphatase 1 regulatory subunit 3B isoform 1-T1 [Synchiropus picturatus]